MRFGVCVPNPDECADPGWAAELARRPRKSAGTASSSGITWCSVRRRALGRRSVGDADGHRHGHETDQAWPAGDPVTRRGPGMLAARRRPWTGCPAAGWYSGRARVHSRGGVRAWSTPVQPKVLARRLDEGLGVLAGLSPGNRMDFHGDEITADVTFQPTLVPRPRPAGLKRPQMPARSPLCRVARWYGVAPTVLSPWDGARFCIRWYREPAPGDKHGSFERVAVGRVAGLGPVT
jgi:hypothetical protein